MYICSNSLNLACQDLQKIENFGPQNGLRNDLWEHVITRVGGRAATRLPYILHAYAHDFGCTTSKTACYGPELMFQLDTHQAKIPRSQ